MIVNARPTRTAVVTGASDGIGAAISERLVDDGWDVLGIDVQRQWPDDERRRLILGDTSDASTFERAIESLDGHAPLVGWVNNAAVAIPGRLHETTTEQLRRTMAVNVEAYFWGCAAAIQEFLRTDVAGAIVNVSSIQASHAFPGWAAYVTSKGAVDALTRYVAVDYGQERIRCNSVAPGNVRTRLAMTVVAEAPKPSEMQHLMDSLAPLGRMVEPPEVAAAVAYLLGDDAAFVTGHNLVIDGGATARCYAMPTAASNDGRA